MAEKNGKQGSGKMVRYCIRGHEIVYREGMLVRSRCPVCNSPVDRSRPPITWEEAERIRTEQEAAGSGGEPSGSANEAAETVRTDHTGAGPRALPSGAEDGDSPRSAADPTALKTDP
ncbi:MAG: hypothetical protein Q4D81_04400, partial [Eubacteriales bacterium]|nr:hypothetical protein [Eubacteriales bacterium]